jgi:hypothetical protein
MQNASCLWLLVTLGLLATTVSAWAQQDLATKQECVDQVGKVVTRITAEGFEAVAPAIKPGGPYSWKADGYVFCLDATQGMMLAHPHLPEQMMNRPLMGWRDSNGKAFIREMLELAHKEGKGWVSYVTRFRGSEEVRLKETYIEKVPGKDVIVGAGYFPPKQ